MQEFEIRRKGEEFVDDPPVATGKIDDEGKCKVFFYGAERDAPDAETAAEWILPTVPQGVEVVWK